MTVPAYCLLVLASLTIVGCESTDWAKADPQPAPIALPESPEIAPGYVSTGRVSNGKASWYCIACNGGTQTASGERLRDYARTAAHKTLPMGTRVLVTNLRNGKSAVVKINDRGPFTKGRIIDVTKGVGQDLGMITAGVVPVTVEVLKKAPVLVAVNAS